MRAKANQAHGETAPGKNASGLSSKSVVTRDEVADEIGIGSGRTYGRAKKIWDYYTEEDEHENIPPQLAEWMVDRMREGESIEEIAKMRAKIRQGSRSDIKDESPGSSMESVRALISFRRESGGIRFGISRHSFRT